ncbi:spore cortex biosynthesis protein YabQ [Alkalihalophilus pseudofirmus]|uniref:Spore cortex biosynthesis protein YabQ n=1 Tax=Alkalihalophilus pseudofirmus TaxID=79885 RepID=A0AAJ2NRJ7_ALKPS|nr:spore cortex biosynthesis protein YabQ [Alkalihalophilus pseudofirmus]MDV2887301.1 spore cortex biosynthesis protein YabQ [Alkalihalophilus pseudofirmus]WEG17044.1 spore cortex biosynthesis protein YabQ [Alkalihalophilus pseudofirmus]
MSLTVQFYTMVSMAAMGIWLGAAIDTYGRFLRKRRSFHWLTALKDVLFWLIQGLIVFYVLLESNHGEVRFYVFLAILCGYACYKALLQNTYQRLLEVIIRLSIAFYRFVTNLFNILLIVPIKYVLKLLYTLGMMVVTAIVAIFLFIFRIIWRPLRWALRLIGKATRIDRAYKKLSPYFLKIKEYIKAMRKKKE